MVLKDFENPINTAPVQSSLLSVFFYFTISKGRAYWVLKPFP